MLSKIFQGTTAQQDTHVTLLAEIFMSGYHDKTRGFTFLIECVDAFLLEASIPTG